MTPSTSTIMTVGGLAVGLVGIVVTVVIAIRSAEKKKPTCCYLTFLKVATSADAPSDILITYKTTPVEQVSSTFLWFWNAGRKPIMRADIPATQPVQIRLLDGPSYATILSCAVRKVTRPAINLGVNKQDETTLSMTFDFLDYGDGAVVEVQHTGGALTVPMISGVVLGAPKGVRVKPLVHPSQIKKARPGIHQGVPSSVFQPRSRRVQVGLSFGAVLVLGGFWLAVRKYGIVDATPLSPEQIRDILKNFLRPAALDSAARAIQSASLPTNVPVAGTEVLLAIAISVCLVVIWGRFRAFPDSLELTPTDLARSQPP